jgi:hypothetical protein
MWGFVGWQRIVPGPSQCIILTESERIRNDVPAIRHKATASVLARAKRTVLCGIAQPNVIQTLDRRWFIRS